MKVTRRKASLALLVGLATAFVLWKNDAAPPGTEKDDFASGETILTGAGYVRGAVDGNALAWKGIPYASDPSDSMRWRAPSPPEPWTGAIDTQKFGARCIQARTLPDGRVGVIGSENCLTLNVWRPRKTTGTSLPVIVFLHGGAFSSGGSSDYTGEFLATSGPAIVVTLNYRLGVFGFLPGATGQPGEAGNFGLLDQITALEWVQRNIHEFGGDPDRVLLVGQSAGAASIEALLTSQRAKGLFAAASLHSGVCSIMTDAAALEARDRLLEAFGCEDVDCLRRVGGPRLASKAVLGSWAPTIDGFVLEREPLATISHGDHIRVPIIVSSVSREISDSTLPHFSNPGIGPILRKSMAEDYESGVRQWLGGRADEYLSLYPRSSYSHDLKAYADARNDLLICRIASLASKLDSWGRVWRLLHAPPGSSEESGHGKDIEVLFGRRDSGRSNEGADVLLRYLVHFASQGNPNAGDQYWPEMDRSAPEALLVSERLSVVPADLHQRNCPFWLD